MKLLERVVVPIATETDAVTTAAALSPYVDGIDHVTVVHVVEKGGGVVDKAPMEKRRADAEEFLSAFEAGIGETVTVDPRVEFGTDVAETIVETAHDVDATAIVFSPRGSNRLVRLLSGDTATRILTTSRHPVVSLRPADDTHSSPKRCGNADDVEVSG